MMPEVMLEIEDPSRLPSMLVWRLQLLDLKSLLLWKVLLMEVSMYPTQKKDSQETLMDKKTKFLDPEFLEDILMPSWKKSRVLKNKPFNSDSGTNVLRRMDVDQLKNFIYQSMIKSELPQLIAKSKLRPTPKEITLNIEERNLLMPKEKKMLKEKLRSDLRNSRKLPKKLHDFIDI